MKRLFVASLTLLLASCGQGSAPKDSKTVYMDNAEASFDSFSANISSVSCYSSRGTDGNYDLSISINLKNTGDQTITVGINDALVTKESNNATYAAYSYAFPIGIDSGITKKVSFSSLLPSDIKEEQYQFSVSFNNCNYTLKLYETPDAERKDCCVRYHVGNNVVSTRFIKERRKLGNYIYENPDHLSHCSKWKTAEKVEVDGNTIITEDINLYGVVEENLGYFELSGWSDSSVQKVQYVPTDGTIVVPSRHGVFTVNALSNYGIYNVPAIEKVYLPRTIATIYSGNFTNCPKLKQIHFEGSMQEWNSIQFSNPVPAGISIIYNSAFSFNR